MMVVRRPKPSSVLTLLILALGVGWIGDESEFGAVFRPLSGFNGFLYDASVAVVSVINHSVPWPDTALILIDQRTLASPSWAATPRALQQPQLGRLGRQILDLGARKVGYDLVVAFDPADLRPPLAAPATYDEAFVGLLKDSASDIVLGTDASLGLAPRYAALLGPASRGVIDLQTEADGTVRSVAARLTLQGGVTFGFADALARDAPDAVLAANRTFIMPPAPIDGIPHLSAAEVEACLDSDSGTASLKRLLKGRTVIVGAALFGEDEHRGPDRFIPSWGSPGPGTGICSGSESSVPSRVMEGTPGAFLQAAAVEAFLLPRPITLAGKPARIVSNLGVAGVGLLLRSLVQRLARVRARHGPWLGTTLRAMAAVPLGLVVLFAAAVALDVAGLFGAGLWIPIGTTTTAIAILGGAQILATALRRDFALADLRIAFGRWLPPPVVEAALGDTPTVLHGQERMITVLFADLKNFTPFCAAHRTNPEQIVSALNRKFTAAQAIIDRHGGCVDKFDGDAVIAFWNGIEAQPDHARRAIAAAAGIVEADRLDPESTLTFKCAVATGIAFVGRYGSDKKSNFSAIGEPMNLAARLESLCRTENLDIVIAKTSVDASRKADVQNPSSARDPVALQRVGEARLKGFADPVSFYTVA